MKNHLKIFDDSIETIVNSLSTQIQLNRFYLRELGQPQDYLFPPQPDEYSDIHLIEDAWNKFEESVINTTIFPQNYSEFINWYNELHLLRTKEVSIFFNWLANEATLEELSVYIVMEEQVAGFFADVIALAQLGLTGDMKLALAESYWSAMGLGKESEIHTILFNDSIKKISALLDNKILTSPSTEALKNGNLFLMYSLRRQYHPRLLGALATLEHITPYRFSRTVKAMKRLNLSEDIIYYHEKHVKINANYGKKILQRVLVPLVKRNPEVIKEICLGCLIRYNIAIDYYKSIATPIS